MTTATPTTTSLPHELQHCTPPPSTVDPASTTVKMEDLAVSFATPAPSSTHMHPTSQLTPSSSTASSPPSSSTTTSETKAVKKRKSWGQVLPEPKTNLPPRKRAKTDDEKEQRRIERVKRNRLAAHNSRERKRQEVELLEAEKNKLVEDLHSFREDNERLRRQLAKFHQKYPGEVDPSFGASPSITSDYESMVDTVCPRQTSTPFPSPISMDSLDSPRDESCQPETPIYLESSVSEVDQTRYPAAILCDLQCRSTTTMDSSSPWMAYLLLFQWSLPSMTALFSTLTSSLSTAWNPTAWWILHLTLSSRHTASAMSQPCSIFLTTLMQSASTCRQPLAQLTLATRLSQRSTQLKQVDSSNTVWASAESRRETEQRHRRVQPSRQESVGQSQGLLCCSEYGSGWTDSVARSLVSA